MKPCPFCAEAIQDAALKCKYCGSWLNTTAAVHYSQVPNLGISMASGLQSKASKSNISSSLLFGIIGSVLFGILVPSLWCATGENPDFARATKMPPGLIPAFICYPISIILFFICYCIGDLFRRITKPSWIVTSNPMDTLKIKLYYVIGPQLSAWVLSSFIICSLIECGLLVKRASIDSSSNVAIDSGAFVNHPEHASDLVQVLPASVPTATDQSQNTTEAAVLDTNNPKVRDADDGLNLRYSEVRDMLNKEGKKRLKSEEVAWLKERDAAVSNSANPNETFVQITTERTEKLESMMSKLEEQNNADPNQETIQIPVKNGVINWKPNPDIGRAYP